MWSSTEESSATQLLDAPLELRDAAVPVAAALPAGIAFAERMVAALRAHLIDRGLDSYRVFHTSNVDFYEAERLLNNADDKAEWEPLAALTHEGEPLVTVTHGTWGTAVWHSGALHLVQHEIVLARRYWLDHDGCVKVQWLCAAPTAEHISRLRENVSARRKLEQHKTWEIVRGEYGTPERIPRVKVLDLFLTPTVRERIDVDILRFFSSEVGELYRTLGVPYRRGVLLYGPPGNGKTSLIRHIGHLASDVQALILRPTANFDSDDLEAVVKRWIEQAPAILVIEDLDWMLERVNVSTFLNILDGIEPAGGGLLLIATTNHPEKLDGAINNRPGRFDVAIEIPNPDAELRGQFLRAKLPEMDEETISRLVMASQGLSFAHLQEILRMSGLLAIHAGRSTRTADDLLHATESAAAANDTAGRGFPPTVEMPFGLAAWKRKR